MQKRSGKEVVRAGKGFTLFILKKDTNDIIKIIKQIEDVGVSIDGAPEIEKHEIRKQEGEILGALLAPLVTSLVNPCFLQRLKVLVKEELEKKK